MSYSNHKLLTQDGLKLHTHQWTIDKPKAQILFVHGYCEHAGRYTSEAQFFNEAGYDFHAYDQRHHGLSEGSPKSYIQEFSSYIDDLELFIKSKASNDNAVILMAHSMGSLVMVSYLLERTPSLPQLKGIVLSAPFLQPDRNTAPILQKLAVVIGTLLPKLKTVGIDSNAISRDENEVNKYVNDPLNYAGKIFARSGYQLLRQMKQIRKKFHKLTLPILIMHGTDDKLAEIGGSQMLYDLCSSEDKEFIVLKDYKHEITRDLDHLYVRETMQSWMDERITA